MIKTLQFARKKIFIWMILVLFFMAPACHSKPKWVLKVGVDPLWFPMDLIGKEPNVLAFSQELLQEISQKKGIKFERIITNWDSLLDGLRIDRYEAILSSMQPFVFNLKKYQFSRIYLATGPVLVVPRTSSFTQLDKGMEKQIGVVNKNDERFLVEHYPEITVRMFSSIATMLTEVVSSTLDGALVSSVLAGSFVSDLFEQELKIVSEPLTEEGLRLITMQGKYREVVRLFNEGVEDSIKSGRYEALLQKWKLST